MQPSIGHSSLSPDPSVLRARRRSLLRWYDEHARDLPWRRRLSLYGTWIAEIMLQQTTVATVIPRWEAFLARFPDVQALAAADEAEVLAAWSGLGYYRRARALHRAARMVAEDLEGRLPESLEGWRALPGVGDYAAGAIASIGLGLPAAAVDANVRRVLTRWSCADPPAADALSDARLTELARDHVPRRRPGDWNQAIMDLGAGRCRAGEPDCHGCPVRAHCAAGQAGTGAGVPRPVPRRKARPVVLGALVLRDGDRVLLLPSDRSVVARASGLGRPLRADLAGLFAGMLGPPLTPWYADAGTGPDPFLAAWRRWLGSLGADVDDLQPGGTIGHAITVYRLRVHVCTARWSVGGATAVPGGAWAPWPAGDRPLSSLAHKILGGKSLA